jgi:hypothetical protein
MEKLLMKYFRNANSYQSIDPTCFNLQEFTETWLEENKEAINYTHCCTELPNECGLLKNINGCDKGSGCRYPNCV